MADGIRHSVAWLKRHGFDGLVAVGDRCSCDLEDHAPGLDCKPERCRPGYKVSCNPETCWVGGGCAYHISASKPSKRALAAVREGAR